MFTLFGSPPSSAQETIAGSEATQPLPIRDTNESVPGSAVPQELFAQAIVTTTAPVSVAGTELLPSGGVSLLVLFTRMMTSICSPTLRLKSEGIVETEPLACTACAAGTSASPRAKVSSTAKPVRRNRFMSSTSLDFGVLLGDEAWSPDSFSPVGSYRVCQGAVNARLIRPSGRNQGWR